MPQDSGNWDDLPQRVVNRLMELWYRDPIVNNVERGFYVEALVESALRQRDLAWRMTDTWAAWDIEHESTQARIEVKQSARLQPWPLSPSAGLRSLSFRIRPSRRWDGEVGRWSDEPPQRWADVYVFARHEGSDREVADQLSPKQWEFCVVPERFLPSLVKSINWKPLTQIAEAAKCGYDALADEILRAIPGLDDLKASSSRQR